MKKTNAKKVAARAALLATLPPIGAGRGDVAAQACHTTLPNQGCATNLYAP